MRSLADRTGPLLFVGFDWRSLILIPSQVDEDNRGSTDH
jgi:hypothetical protein